MYGFILCHLKVITKYSHDVCTYMFCCVYYINHIINQSVSQSVNQSTNQSINQSIILKIKSLWNKQKK